MSLNRRRAYRGAFAAALTYPNGAGSLAFESQQLLLTKLTDHLQRLGLAASYAKSTTMTNGAASDVSLNRTEARTYTLAVPNSFASMTAATRSVLWSGTAKSSVAGGADDSKSLSVNMALSGADTTPTVAVTTGTLSRTLTLDKAGRVKQVAVPGLHNVVMAYDVEGRLSTVTQSTRSVAFAYDATTGFLSSTTVNPGANQMVTSVTSRDGLGRPKEMTLPGGRPVSMAYDFGLRKFTVTPPGTKTQSAQAEARSAHPFVHDVAGLLTNYTAPGATSSTDYIWDKDRALTDATLPIASGGAARGVWTNYDAAGRVASFGHATSATAVSRSAKLDYDTAGRLQTVTTTLNGSLASTLETTYLSGLVTRERSTFNNAGPLFSKDIDYAYDGLLRTKRRTIDGTALNYTYDSSGLLYTAGGITLTRATGSGMLTALTSGSLVTTITPTSFGEPDNIETKFGATSKYLVTLTRDAFGRISTRHEVSPSGTVDRSYDYDTAGRLWKVYNDLTKTSLAATYTYDANGNRQDLTYLYDVQDRQLTFGTTTYAYETDGSFIYFTETGRVVKMQLDGQVVLSWSDPAPAYLAVAGGYLIWVSGSGIWRAPTGGGAPETIGALDGAGATGVTVKQGLVYISSWGGGVHVVRLNPATKALETVFSSFRGVVVGAHDNDVLLASSEPGWFGKLDDVNGGTQKIADVDMGPFGYVTHCVIDGVFVYPGFTELKAISTTSGAAATVWASESRGVACDGDVIYTVGGSPPLVHELTLSAPSPKLRTGVRGLEVRRMLVHGDYLVWILESQNRIVRYRRR